MPPRAKKTSSKAAASAAARREAAKASRAAQAVATKTALTEWIAKHDTLLDRAEEHPIKLSTVLTDKLAHRSFSRPGVGESSYDWSDFRRAVEGRSASSPRWFVQLREEDLLLGPDGLEGVTVDCFVIAEASEPTLSPSEYVVKVHWPFSDAEDNAPERILPIAGQDMCWRRVVKDSGEDINFYLLQRRGDPVDPAAARTSSASFGFGGAAPQAGSPAPVSGAVAPASTSAAGGFSFGFGATGTAPPASSSTTAAPGFGFGFGAPASTPAAPTVPPAAPAFGFGSAAGEPQQASAVAPSGFNFSFNTTKDKDTAAAAPGAVVTEPLKTSEVLFTLWSRRRLMEMAREVKSGSRIVRDNFPLDANTSIKLVMQNDRTDDIALTVRRLLLNRIFAKSDPEVRGVDKWIADCPVYDEALTNALQKFREEFIDKTADESEEFEELFNRFHEVMEEELARIKNIRMQAAQGELDSIAAITEKLKEHKVAEKHSFRLLKYYAKNDVLPFRPFGKISGISEMGEAADVCVPPAHVNINPFTGKPS